MNYNKHKTKPTKKEVFNTLQLMCLANPKLETLIDKLDLWIDNPKTNELMDSNEIIKQLKINKQKQLKLKIMSNVSEQNKKVSAKMVKEVESKFKNEIVADEQGEKLPFFKIEEGETIEGIFLGFDDINFKKTPDKGFERVYKIDVNNQIGYLPSNYQLSQKMAKIAELKHDNLLEIQITNEGKIKLDTGFFMTQFKVLTA